LGPIVSAAHADRSALLQGAVAELERLIDRDNRHRLEMKAKIMATVTKLQEYGLDRKQLAVLRRAARKR
jgi:hypothetical protein